MENWLALTVQSFFLTAACLTVGLCRFRVLEQFATLWGESQLAFLRLVLLRYNCKLYIRSLHF